MRVRMVQQVQGDRNGQPWPEPGSEVDLPDDEARSLISGGTAVDSSAESAKVLVPPMGIHTPGRSAMPADAVAPLVEVPEDAVSHQDEVRAALKSRDDGNYVEGPPGIAHQKSTGQAYTQKGLDKAGEDEQRTREALAAGSPPKVGESADRPTARPSSPAKAQPNKP